MEIRQISQVCIYCLDLNPVTGRFEDIQTVAVSTQLGPLLLWYQDQFAEQVWADEGGGKPYHKHFRKGSPLEWYNPHHSPAVNQVSLSTRGGISSIWLDTDKAQAVLDSSSYQVICKT